MHLPEHLFSGKDGEQFRSFVQNILDTVEKQSVQIEKQNEQLKKQSMQIEKLTEDNEKLRAEIRHLKKQKGKPKIRPNVPDQTDQGQTPPEEDATVQGSTQNNSGPPPKGKRPKQQPPGETAAPPITVDCEEICKVPNPQKGWRFKGYYDSLHTEMVVEFVTTLYRREYYLTPEGIVSAPLPEHVKGRFGDNLKSHALDFYHSFSTTQPLLLAWMQDHGCPISEGALSNILTCGHDAFHQEKEELLDAGIACSKYLQADDTGARHQGKNGYCLAVGNEFFTYFSSTASKSRINFLTRLQGKQCCYLLDSVAIDYMKQVKMAGKWVEALSASVVQAFNTSAEWETFLDQLGLTTVPQRRLATEGVLKAALVKNRCLESMIIHSDGARQFDTAFQHSLCWYHAGRPLDKLIPGNALERAARDWIQDQYWLIYDDLEDYRQNPTEKKKQQIKRDFDHWVTTRVDYPDLQDVLGRLMVFREELLLVLEYPWLPLNNNLMERQIREYVKRRKVSGGTRSGLGQMCRDTFASLKKTCKQHGISFAKYLKDRISETHLLPRLKDLILQASGYQETVIAS